MPNYLTKEEIKQWRSSLEKITLEEFAARLGKTIETEKPTNDVVDIVMSKGTSSHTNKITTDGFSAIAERAFKREQQISHTPFSRNKNIAFENNAVKDENKTFKNAIDKVLQNNVSKNESVQEIQVEDQYGDNADDIILKKALTDREQLVFEYFVNNINKTVFAKDLALLLDLPRDYVYKYIKNLRAKIEGNRLQNVPSGGFILLGK